MSNKSQWVETLMEMEFEALFKNLHSIEGLKSGDITPDQDDRLEKIKADLSELLNEYVNQNR